MNDELFLKNSCIRGKRLIWDVRCAISEVSNHI